MWQLLSFVSAILSAFAAIGEKKSLQKLSPLEVSFQISLFSLLFSLPLLLFGTPSMPSIPAIAVLVIKSCINAAAFYFVMSALKHLDVSNSLPMMELSPGLVAILAWISLGESLTMLQIGGLLLLGIGSYLMNAGKDLLGPFKVFLSKGYRYIGLAILAFSVSSIMDKLLVVNLGMKPEQVVVIQNLVTACIFAIAFLAAKKRFTFDPVLGMVGLITVGYRYAQILAVRQGPVALVLAIKRTSVFFASLMAGRIFKEKDIARRVVATIILICGSLLVTIY